MGRISKEEKIAQLEKLKAEEEAAPLDRDLKYTVVVEMSDDTATIPRIPTKVYVLPTARLSRTTLEEFREAAAKGGCQIRVFTAGDSGIESVKWDLMHYGATVLD